MTDRIPLEVFGYPEEVINVMIFLSSDSASIITCEIIHINGGTFSGWFGLKEPIDPNEIEQNLVHTSSAVPHWYFESMLVKVQ
jgi:hypothetical protein